MASISHQAASFLLLRSEQAWTHIAKCECLPLLPSPAQAAVCSYGRTEFVHSFVPRTHLCPAGSSLCSQNWRRLERLGERQASRLSFHKWRCSVQEDPHVLLASSMEDTYDALAHRLLSAAVSTEPGKKYMVGIAGPPGAGKSTVAQEVVVRLNALWSEKQKDIRSADAGPSPTDIAVAVPMDGFHLYRWQLDAMEDPDEAHSRRGAHWTFDPASLVQNLQHLRSQGWAHFPSFDHGVGDPVEKDIYITPMHKVVVVEGNYLLLEEGDWKSLEGLFDERWFVEIDIDEAMERVEKRHIATGKTPEIAKWRVVYNDRPNAELIALSKWNADLIIPSIAVC